MDLRERELRADIKFALMWVAIIWSLMVLMELLGWLPD